MRFLLDTHILLWAVADPARLPAVMTDLLSDQSQSVYFSVINLWEMVIKSALPRKDFSIDPVLTRSEALAFGFRELQVTAEHAFAFGSLPSLHKDPFDRLLIAQARAEGTQLLTVDPQIERYFVQELNSLRLTGTGHGNPSSQQA